MTKKSTFVCAILFISQAISCLAAFFYLVSQRKSAAKVFLALSFGGGVTGGILLRKYRRKVKEEKKLINDYIEMTKNGEDKGDVEILTDDEVDESEFA